MKNIIINNKSYKLACGYQKNDMQRAEFNKLIHAVFGFTFEFWYQNGYWTNKYTPYTLFKDNIAIANVSVNQVNFRYNNSTISSVQIGTVATNKIFRNMGLCSYLMDHVIEEWQEKCDLLYLFANESSIGLYPKFGFNRAIEYEYSIQHEASSSSDTTLIYRLDMKSQSDRNLVFKKARLGNPYARFSMIENSELVMFYCTFPYSDCVYYHKEYDVVVIAKNEGATLHIYDIFGTSQVGLELIINSICKELGDITNTVFLGFTPASHLLPFTVKEKTSSDPLFIFNKGRKLFSGQLNFPELSHA